MTEQPSVQCVVAPVEPVFVTYDEAAELARCSVDLLRDEVKAGRLKCASCGRRRLIRLETLREWARLLEEVEATDE